MSTSPAKRATSTSRLYLEELLQNLITNAIKYTPEGSVTVSSVDCCNVCFGVDTGIGIGKSDQRKFSIVFTARKIIMLAKPTAPDSASMCPQN